MSITLITLITMLFLLCATILRAGEVKPASAVDPKVMEAMQPGPEHQVFAAMVGTWDVSCSMWMASNAPAMQSTGVSVFRSILGGRFLQADFTGSFQGQPFTGLSLLGYDRGAKHYTTTWCDSMATAFIYLTGTSTDQGKTIRYDGEMVCPQLGHTTLRQVESHESDDQFTVLMYQKPDSGKEFKSMELVYRRRR